MATSALLIDCSPPYLDAGKRRTSLLLARVGRGSLLTLWRDRLAPLEVDSLAVVPAFAANGDYRAAIREISPDAEILPADRVDGFVHRRELTDRLLIIDSRHYPVAGNGLASLLQADPRQCVVHLTYRRRNHPGLRERVVVDSERRVQRIERLYAGVTDLGSISIVCSLFSVAAARCLRQPNYLDLAALRAGLVAAGLPSRDVTASMLVTDLGTEQGLLNLNEHLLTSSPDADLQTAFREVRAGVWAAPNCRIHSSCKLVGPAILNEDVTVQHRARVVGPVVVGAGVDVGSDATLACCVVGDQAHIPGRSRFANRVLMPNFKGPAARKPASWMELLEAEQTRHELRRMAKPQRTEDRLGSTPYNAAKRVFDVGATLCGLITLSPLLILVALLIKLTSRGPILFGHARESRGGRPFRCWKFRTMVERAHAQQRALYAQNAVDGPQFKLRNDPRVTPLGRILRTTNIDELPQLLNVLLGHMSLVGPRPSPFRENQICIPWREARLSVLPGITGLWQVCRHDRDTGDFHQWIFFDVLYARHRSFAVDLRILLATFLTLGGRWGVPVSWVIPGYQAGWTQRPNAKDVAV